MPGVKVDQSEALADITELIETRRASAVSNSNSHLSAVSKGLNVKGGGGIYWLELLTIPEKCRHFSVFLIFSRLVVLLVKRNATLILN